RDPQVEHAVAWRDPGQRSAVRRDLRSGSLRVTKKHAARDEIHHGLMPTIGWQAPGYRRVSRQLSWPVYALPVSGSRTSLSGWLARMGFADVPRAERELTALGVTGQGIAGEGHPLLAALARAADPDLALAGLAQVAERDQGLIAAL